jgi:hypothetical protein
MYEYSPNQSRVKDVHGLHTGTREDEGDDMLSAWLRTKARRRDVEDAMWKETQKWERHKGAAMSRLHVHVDQE